MRAGKYIKQIEGYKAFIPNQLPPDPLRLDWETIELLANATESLGRLDGIAELLPDPNMFVAMYIRQEAILSSQIEGTQASLVEILEYESNKEMLATKDIYEVMNYIKAINYGLDRLRTLPLSLRLIKEIHSLLLENTRGHDKNPGEFRRTQNWIGPEGCTLTNATFVPPPVYEMNIAMGKLELFLHNDQIRMPMLIRIGLAHAQFETIHPFLDGNGRMGRLLITFLLCSSGILKRPLLYLSYYFKKNRQQYYEKLQSIRDNDTWEEWLNFFLIGVNEISMGATEKAKSIIRLKESHREIASKLGANAVPLLELLYQQPFISVADVSTYLDMNYSSANRLISTFEDNKIITKTRPNKQRNRVFEYTDYLDLFNDII